MSGRGLSSHNNICQVRDVGIRPEKAGKLARGYNCRSFWRNAGQARGAGGKAMKVIHRIAFLAQHYGQTLASGPGLASFVSVPEPMALGVVVWACAVVFRRRETSQKAKIAANPMMPAMRIGPAA